ncbi:SRPBCC family protein [Maritalea sp.]|jgi:uncharacterized protein YndB with AHSA1/START domain|uniref:SRPBCC family protein n=1 Tax=Maritalea sp. TaxID=2003361 RepID=UPI0039E56EF4
MIEPVIVEVTTKKNPKDAFAFFTGHMHQFWPQNHSIGEGERSDLIVDMHEGGRWYEVCGGKECDWGKVLEFVPGEKILFAWHLNADWEFDPDVYTEVVVEFAPHESGTRVRLTHSKLERFGSNAPKMREALGATGGWQEIIGAFAKIAA